MSVEPIPINRGKSKLVAVLLAVFLGGLGFHHFYLGSVGAGLLCLVATCCFGFGYLIGWLEAALLVVMSDGEFESKYNEREPGSTEFVFTGR